MSCLVTSSSVNVCVCKKQIDRVYMKRKHSIDGSFVFIIHLFSLLIGILGSGDDVVFNFSLQ